MSMSLTNNRPPPPQQTKRLTSCQRHPGEPITGFCAPCLSERLCGLDPVAGSHNASSSSSFPELRRSKSFSVNRINFSVAEPRRKSCDVRARNTLSSLFSLEDGRNVVNGGVENGKLGFCENVGTVFEEEDENDDEIRASEEENVPKNERGEEEEEEEEEHVEIRTMKEHIDLEWENQRKQNTRSTSRRDFKDIAGNIWVVASVFSKKLLTWRQRQKLRLQSGSGGHTVNNLEVERVNGSNLIRETQSEIGEYGFYGRRSCDTDPRFSIDAGRVSLDCPRLSFDHPRASWDGHLIGRGLPRPPNSLVLSEEKIGGTNQLDRSPGGSAETRDYYSRPRRSFDQSSSIKRAGGGGAGAAFQVDEIKSVSNSNSKVSPTTVEMFHGAKVLLTERDLKESSLNMNAQGNDCSESTDTGSSVAASVVGGGERKGLKMFTGWRKAWTIWGLIPKRNDIKFEDVGEPSPRQSLERLGGVSNGEVGVEISRNASSHASSSSSAKMSRSFKSSAVIRCNGNERREHFVLERNRSARYSPNNHEHGLLRFYLTPLRSRRKCSKSRLK